MCIGYFVLYRFYRTELCIGYCARAGYGRAASLKLNQSIKECLLNTLRLYVYGFTEAHVEFHRHSTSRKDVHCTLYTVLRSYSSPSNAVQTLYTALGLCYTQFCPHQSAVPPGRAVRCQQPTYYSTYVMQSVPSGGLQPLPCVQVQVDKRLYL